MITMDQSEVYCRIRAGKNGKKSKQQQNISYQSNPTCLLLCILYCYRSYLKRKSERKTHDAEIEYSDYVNQAYTKNEKFSWVI